MASRVAPVLGRILLVVLGVVLLAAAWAFTRMPRPASDRVEAALDVVGVSSGGSFAWVVRTRSGAALIDAGLDPEAEAILAELKAQGLTADQVHTVLITHGHRDHWGGASKFPRAKVYVGPGDAALVRGEQRPKSLAAPVLERVLSPGPTPAGLEELKGGETLEVDGMSFRVVHVPGHTPGSVMYLRDGLLFTGDSLLGKDGQVVPPPSALSDDPAENVRSLRKLLALPFTTIADGHTGAHADARQRLAALLE